MILMPLKTGQTIHSDVLLGIASQTVPMPLLVVTADAYPSPAPREVSINATRHKLQDMARTFSPAYSSLVLLLDSDVVMSDPSTIEAMRDALEADSSLIASAVDTKQSGGHTLASCCLMRWEHYELIRYWDRPEQCQCLKIANMGRIEYIGIHAHEVKR